MIAFYSNNLNKKDFMCVSCHPCHQSKLMLLRHTDHSHRHAQWRSSVTFHHKPMLVGALVNKGF